MTGIRASKLRGKLVARVATRSNTGQQQPLRPGRHRHDLNRHLRSDDRDAGAAVTTAATAAVRIRLVRRAWRATSSGIPYELKLTAYDGSTQIHMMGGLAL